MNNKKLTEKVLKKIDYDKYHQKIGKSLREIIQLTIAEKDAQKDLFIEKLKDGIEAEIKVAEKIDSNNARQSLIILRMILTGINLKNKEVFGDE